MLWPMEDRGPIKAQHGGETINGIRVIDPLGEDGKSLCPGKKERADTQFPFEASYLPPNTFSISEPEVLVCPDGRFESAHLRFQNGREGTAFFSVHFVTQPGQAFVFGTGEVRPMTINGLPAVSVAPEVYEGVEIGTARVVIDTLKGSIGIVGTNMPLEELIKVAEGVKCADC